MPHSEIPGSPIARISPGLFAACHVLHRLSVPRHPPDALLFALDHRHPRRRERRTTAAHRAKPPGTTPQTGDQSQRARPPARGAASAPALLVPCRPAKLGFAERPRCTRNAAQHRLRRSRPRMKTLLRTRHRPASTLGHRPRRSCPPRSHHNSLFTRQSTTPPRSPATVVLLRRTPLVALLSAPRLVWWR